MIVSASASTVVYCVAVRNASFGGACAACSAANASADASDKYGQTASAPIAFTIVRRDMAGAGVMPFRSSRFFTIVSVFVRALGVHGRSPAFELQPCPSGRIGLAMHSRLRRIALVAALAWLLGGA